jgi:hypothetical protein
MRVALLSSVALMQDRISLATVRWRRLAAAEAALWMQVELYPE